MAAKQENFITLFVAMASAQLASEQFTGKLVHHHGSVQCAGKIGVRLSNIYCKFRSGHGIERKFLSSCQARTQSVFGAAHMAGERVITGEGV